MELATLNVTRAEAREAFLEYRRAVREPGRHRLDEAERDYLDLDRAVMRGYKAIAAGKQVIHLSQTLSEGGVQECEGRLWNGNMVTRTLPNIAVVRADARSVWCRGVNREGGVAFRANDDGDWRRRRADIVRSTPGIFEAPEGQGAGVAFRAIVPTIPPHLRPPFKLSGYHVLFEAVWASVAPVDPALLKHLGGELYAVLAVWDLTPLEQAVLGGIRSEA